eukprot:6782-Heterococcus_DN1.PRE.3
MSRWNSPGYRASHAAPLHTASEHRDLASSLTLLPATKAAIRAHTRADLSSDAALLHKRVASHVHSNAPARYRSIEQVAVESLRAPIAAAELVSLIFFELHELLRRAVDAETAAKRCGVLTDQRERHRDTEQSELDALRLQVEQLKWSVQSVTEEVTAQCTVAAAAAHDAQSAQQQQIDSPTADPLQYCVLPLACSVGSQAGAAAAANSA